MYPATDTVAEFWCECTWKKGVFTLVPYLDIECKHSFTRQIIIPKRRMSLTNVPYNRLLDLRLDYEFRYKNFPWQSAYKNSKYDVRREEEMFTLFLEENFVLF